MDIAITKMSSKGQIVIPNGLRERLGLKEGERFMIVGEDDGIFLKKINIPDKKEIIKNLKRIAEEGRKRAEELGIKESDIPNIVHRMRGINNDSL